MEYKKPEYETRYSLFDNKGEPQIIACSWNACNQHLLRKPENERAKFTIDVIYVEKHQEK